MNIGLAKPQVIERYVQIVVDDIKKYRQLIYDVNGDVILNEDGTPYVCIQTSLLQKLVGKWGFDLERATTSGLFHVPIRISDSNGEDGAFNPASWELSLSSDLSDSSRTHMSARRSAELAITMYHEMRHAEQYFLMAYYVCVAYPNMSETDLHLKLAGTNQEAIRKAKQKAGTLDKDLYDFGKTMYQGEIGKTEQKYKELLVLSKQRIQRLVDLRERTLANEEVSRVMEYKRDLNEEIGKYNQNRPKGTLPERDETGLKEGGEYNVAKRWWELVDASKNFGKAPGKYYQAYFRYLLARRGFAAGLWKKAYSAYASTEAEHDAFAVEEQLKIRLKKQGLSLTEGREIRLLMPVDWSTSHKPAPPAIPSSGSDLKTQ